MTDTSATGAGTASTKTIDQIARLIALANGGGPQGEADSARARALTLAARHNVDLAYAQARLDADERPIPQERRIHVGGPRQRGVRDAVSLLAGLAEAHNCKAFALTGGGEGTDVDLIGFPANLNVVQTLFESLVLQMAVEGDTHLRTRDKSETDPWGRPISGASARKSFNQAFVVTITRRVCEAAEQQSAAAAREHTEQENTGAQLVRVEQRQQVEAAVDTYHQRNHVRSGAYDAGRPMRGSADAITAGDAAARNADLGQHRTRGIGQ